VDPSSNEWLPQNIYEHHSGFKVYTTEEEKSTAVQQADEWASYLLERGYHNTNQALAKIFQQ
jgi:hypothetical protein